jgi:NIPSNAP protein
MIRTLSFVLAGGLAAAAAIAAEPGPRTFELRTYTAAPGKLEALNARFRDHTNALFAKHGMTIIGFWVPSDKDKGSDNTLVYLLAFPDRAGREKSWDDFRKDPQWIAARDASEASGKLVEKVDSLILTATDYSPMK